MATGRVEGPCFLDGCLEPLSSFRPPVFFVQLQSLNQQQLVEEGALLCIFLTFFAALPMPVVGESSLHNPQYDPCLKVTY